VILKLITFTPINTNVPTETVINNKRLTGTGMLTPFYSQMSFQHCYNDTYYKSFSMKTCTTGWLFHNEVGFQQIEVKAICFTINNNYEQYSVEQAIHMIILS